MLQCLMAAVRPLSVEELAELLAFEFDETRGGVPKYHGAWRLDNQTQAIMSICSSLVTIVDTRYSGQIVQFSHFSVKEFLMSNRLGDFSQYHIHPISAHLILTQACLGFLLHFDDHIDKRSVKNFPLAEYATQHWVEHAKFEDVASRVEHGMEILFDTDRPHFAAWVRIYDIDNPEGVDDHAYPFSKHRRGRFMDFESYFNSEILKLVSKPNPVYYSVRCGIYDLVKCLAIKYPNNVNDVCGRYRFPLFAALEAGRFDLMELLLEHGADIDARETTGKTILLRALSSHPPNLVSLVKTLLKYGADVNAQDYAHRSSLQLAESIGNLDVAQLLVENNADVNIRGYSDETFFGPLGMLLEHPRHKEHDVLNHTRLLLEHGAEVNTAEAGNLKETPLHLAVRRAWFKFAGILLEYGANPNAEDNKGKTPLHILAECEIRDDGEVLDHTLLLLKHGAEANSRDENKETPLHLAIRRDKFKFVGILLGHGADANAENNDGMTPLHMLAKSWIEYKCDALNVILLLCKYSAELNRRDINNETPLHQAIRLNQFKLARILIEHGADANAENNDGMTPLHILAEIWIEYNGGALALALLKNGVEANIRDKNKETPLHLAMRWRRFKLAGILLEHGADANAENNDGTTPFHILAEIWIEYKDDSLNIALLLLKHGAEANIRDKNKETPLHLAMRWRRLKLAGILLENGVDENAENNDGMTPLHVLAESWIEYESDALKAALLLLKHGADANSRDRNKETPLHLAIRRDQFELVGILLEHGANANAENNDGMTPLHVSAEGWTEYEGDAINISLLLLKHGSEVNKRDIDNETPLHLAIRWNNFELAGILLEHDADANAENIKGRAPILMLSESQNSNKSDFADQVQLLLQILERGMGENPRDEVNKISLRRGIGKRQYEFTRIVIKSCADESELKMSETSVYQGQNRGVDLIALKMDQMMSSQLGSNPGPFQIATLLLYHGAKLNIGRNGEETSLYQEAKGECYDDCVDITQYQC